MSKKRRRDTDVEQTETAVQQTEELTALDHPVAQTSKKRKREVDLELVKVYESLADEQEDVRLAAAHTLLSKIYKPGVTTKDQTKTILTRLFRGLCSSRKSARLGFSVALTELLSQVDSSPDASADIPTPAIIDILEAQSVAEQGISSQSERDHYFGAVFGADAILKAGLLFNEERESHFDRLLEHLLDLALKKPWLRQECGWVLFDCVSTENNGLRKDFAKIIIEKLVAKKLIRTPEGLSIWVATVKRFPKAKLPKSAWKSGDPFAAKDVKILADILKDARAHPNQDQSELGAQGSASWSANLHFAWDVILAEMFRRLPVELQNGKSLENGASHFKPLTFDTFWKVVVDESLFATSTSTERKASGFNLWRKAFEAAPQEMLIYTVTPQAINCLTRSLKSPERLLQKSAQRLTHTIQVRLAGAASWPAAGNVASSYLRALIRSVSCGDYDQATKSKIVQNLIDSLNPSILLTIITDLLELAKEGLLPGDSKVTLQMQRTIVGLVWKIISVRLRHWELCHWTRRAEIQDDDWQLVSSILQSWTREVCVSPNAALPKGSDGLKPVLQPLARNYAKERLDLGLEQGLKLGSLGCELLESVLLEVSQLETLNVEMAIVFEDDVQAIVQTAWQRLSATQAESSKKPTTERVESKSPQSSAQSHSLSFSEGLRLLYCLLLLQIYCGETEAVPILQEVLEYHNRRVDDTSRTQASTADGLVDVLLSFASRPSKLLRRISIQLFDAFAPYLTGTGLEALIRVLETKENLQGQQEMFQAEGVDVDDDEDSEHDSDVEEVGSDVDDESSTSASNDGSEEGTDDDSDSEAASNGEEQDEEMAKLDAALASVLGTRSLNQNENGIDSDTSSDEDMDDEEMMELDLKLAEVFRARTEEQSKNKKKDAKDAKENIVNFKNRVLDLIESYLKHQQRNPFSIDLLLPILKLARSTQTKQLADRSCNMIQQFCSRCKGPHVPELQLGSQTHHATDILKLIHHEASEESSNTHSNAASLSSILIVKALVKADALNIKAAVEVYASTRLNQLTEKTCRILPGFFTDWNNWCQTARDRLAN